jgi:hypothetical protein
VVVNGLSIFCRWNVEGPLAQGQDINNLTRRDRRCLRDRRTRLSPEDSLPAAGREGTDVEN